MESTLHIELFLALVLLVGAVTSFALEKIKMEITAILLLGLILIGSFVGMEHWPSTKDISFVLSSDAPLAIMAMFIVSSALSKQGIIERLTNYLQKLTQIGFHPFLLILLISVAFFSAFINNTPVVVILLPVAIGLSRTLGVASSKLLIPISYASIFGGCCTLIGTSTNILASGFMSSSSLYPSMGPMRMFELAEIGIPLMIVGTAFLVLFGKKLLPEREALSKILSDINRKEYLAEALIMPNSSLVDQLVTDSPIAKTSGVRVLDIVRDSKSLAMPLNEIKLCSGDRLILSCRPQGLIDVREVEGFKLFDQSDLGIEQLNTSEAMMVEAMIKPTSGLLSQSLSEADFRGRFNLTVVALHRKGKNLRLRLNQIKLQTGDSLLLLGAKSSIEKLRGAHEMVLLDKSPIPLNHKTSKTVLSLGILLSIIAIATTGILPLHVVALLGAGFLILTNLINLREAIRSIEWNLLLLIYSMLALGLVMEKSGASSLLAEFIKHVCMVGLSNNWQVIGALIILYIFTALLTELLSNNATIAIMTPVALMVAYQFGLSTHDARAFVLTCCIASSASFMTPIGYQTNTFVYTAGGYRFRDFTKFGLWPTLIYFLGTITMVCFLWKFSP